MMSMQMNNNNIVNLSDYFNYNFNEVTFNSYAENIRSNLATSIKRLRNKISLNNIETSPNIKNKDYVFDYLFNKLPIELGGISHNLDKKDIINYFDETSIHNTPCIEIRNNNYLNPIVNLNTNDHNIYNKGNHLLLHEVKDNNIVEHKINNNSYKYNNNKDNSRDREYENNESNKRSSSTYNSNKKNTSNVEKNYNKNLMKGTNDFHFNSNRNSYYKHNYNAFNTNNQSNNFYNNSLNYNNIQNDSTQKYHNKYRSYKHDNFNNNFKKM